MWGLLVFAAKLATLTARLVAAARSRGNALSMIRLLAGAYWSLATLYWHRFLKPRLRGRFVRMYALCYILKPMGGRTWRAILAMRR